MHIIYEYKKYLSKNGIKRRLTRVLETQISEHSLSNVELEQLITTALEDVQQTNFEISSVQVQPPVPSEQGVYRGKVALLENKKLEYVILDFILCTT